MSKSSSVLAFSIILCSFLTETLAFPEQRQQQPSRTRNLIINGTDAAPGRYPYFTTLDHYCGGALIAPDIVITAGHCRPQKRTDVRPRVGVYDLPDSEDDDDDDDSEDSSDLGNDSDDTDDYDGDDDDEYSFEEISIAAIRRHPGYVRVGDDEFINDYTIIKLNKPSPLPYIRLNRDPSLPVSHQEVTVMGVGNTSPDFEEESRSNILQEVQLKYVANEECKQYSDPDREASYADRIYPSHLCTTGRQVVHNFNYPNLHDSCAYDSGSPIIIPGNNHDNSDGDILIGLVSWGEECADPIFPGVNSRISNAIHWIDFTVCELSDHAPADFNCSDTLSPFESTTWYMILLYSPIRMFLTICGLFLTVYILKRIVIAISSQRNKRRSNYQELDDINDTMMTEKDKLLSPATVETYRCDSSLSLDSDDEDEDDNNCKDGYRTQTSAIC